MAQDQHGGSKQAKILRPNTKTEAKLSVRQDDYKRMLESKIHENKVELRMDNGGYLKPGSNKKIH